MNDNCYIVSGNRVEFEEYCRRKFDENVALGTKPKSYVYVESADRLRGMNVVHGFFIGTYKQRPDIAEIKERILVINTRTKPSIFSPKGMNPVSVWLDEFPSIVGSMSTKV